MCAVQGLCTINEIQNNNKEVIVYYRDVTIKKSDGTTEQAVGATNSTSRRPSIGLWPRPTDE